MWGTNPRLMLFGAIPAVVIGAVYVAGLIVLVLNVEGVAEWVTPFAANWDEPWRTLLRVTAMVALVAVASLLVAYTYTALTLAVGQPFYERIWRHTENRAGGIQNEVEVPFWRGVGSGLVEALRVLSITAAFGLALFVLGFIPVVGQTIVPVLGACIAGWFLAAELSTMPFEARGVNPRDRRIALARVRPTALGFGVASYLVFLVPLGAVILMPAAVAGATLLGRQALGETTREFKDITP